MSPSLALLSLCSLCAQPLFFKRGKSSMASPSPMAHRSNGGGSFSSNSSSSSSSITGVHAPPVASPSFNLTSWCYQTLQDLPAENYRTFTFVCAFLREVLKHEDKHGLGPEELSTCVAGSIMQRIPDEAFSDKVSYTPIQIMQHLLTSDEFTSK